MRSENILKIKIIILKIINFALIFGHLMHVCYPYVPCFHILLGGELSDIIKFLPFLGILVEVFWVICLCSVWIVRIEEMFLLLFIVSAVC